MTPPSTSSPSTISLLIFFTFLSTLLSYYLALTSFLSSFYHRFSSPKTFSTAALQLALKNAPSYAHWEATAYALDAALGNDRWRNAPESSLYDHNLIAARKAHLAAARLSGRPNDLATALRAGLLRNIGSIAAPALYTRAHAGTKLLIEAYIAEVIRGLEHLNARPIPKAQDVPLAANSMLASSQLKRDFFRNTRQAFGRTALVLRGGSIFGLVHIGVARSLLLHGLLPKIVAGAGASALAAAFLCAVPDVDLLSTIDSVASVKSNYNSAFPYSGQMVAFAHQVCTMLGQTTFEEAHARSGRALNIALAPSTHAVPRLLNYLSAPTVTVASAVAASLGPSGPLATPDSPPHLYCKDHAGNITEYAALFLPKDAPKPTYTRASLTEDDDNDSWSVPSRSRDSPYTRMTELFNVNNLLVSIAPPHFTLPGTADPHRRSRPRNVSSSSTTLAFPNKYSIVPPRVVRAARIICLHRLRAVARVAGMSPGLRAALFPDPAPPDSRAGGCTGLALTIAADAPGEHGLVAAVINAFDPRKEEKAKETIKVGEKAVWPELQIIWARCAIEFVLDDLYAMACKK
ncbi:uncharacterized protein SAPINGB_P001554 [Magnusiomyces paraingens]|uniref:PNPLA domain-containing protein n=1 Tax=Magnusiomyces paraingens TaxID=2606893 RepID=A0A5E8B6Z1_9ASCO|nr:uncharacterized protein SAPINGB_P001554 [Saprochaete ingens]VVT47123.1 unnamed protein product [Saprochaete ingens]